jgi:signal transduction histidine kinase
VNPTILKRFAEGDSPDAAKLERSVSADAVAAIPARKSRRERNESDFINVGRFEKGGRPHSANFPCHDNCLCCAALGRSTKDTKDHEDSPSCRFVSFVDQQSLDCRGFDLVSTLQIHDKSFCGFPQGLLYMGPNVRMKERPASFFGNGWLIMLPVCVLAAIGLHALRQDRRMIDAEAKDRAHQMANAWIDAISADWLAAEDGATNRQSLVNSLPLGQGPPGFFFALDSAASLVFPPPYESVPDPQPLDPAELNPTQAELWRAAITSEGRALGVSSVTAAYLRFLDSVPPTRFAASARYNRALCLIRESKNQSAQAIWQSMVEDYSAEVTETGIPWRHLAQLQLLQHSQVVPADLEMIRSNAVYRPSLLTPQLLDLADRAKEQAAPQLAIETDYRTIWTQHEWTRGAFRRLRNQLSFSPNQPVRVPPVCWLRFDKTFAVVRLSAANAEITKLLAIPAGELPVSFNRHAELAITRGDVFGVTVGVAGIVLYQEGFPADSSALTGNSEQELAGQIEWPVLATATRIEDGAEILKVRVHLTNSALFYARHRQRTVWLAAVIAAAAGAAVLGWITTRRAFRRQQQLAEMKTNFVSSVSHELRAPIASVRLLAEGLESGRIQDETKKHEYFKFIVQECRRLSSLIENVLDFSRIEQGRKQYDVEPTDVTALLHQTARLMEPYAADRQVHLEVASNSSQPSTLNSQPLLDGRAIQQALVNLIDNAIKHSPKGSTVTIGLELPSAADVSSSNRSRRGNETGRSASPKSASSHRRLHFSSSRLDKNSGSSLSDAPRFRIWVEDHGAGIPLEEHERIFERFYRLGSELRRETQGVGIGLSIVKHIVEGHGGRVIVRSAVGQGSRLTMELPLSPLKSEN